MEHERIFTETPKQAIWDRIDILTTINGVKSQLLVKCEQSQIQKSEELILEKSKGVAFCIRSARDLFKQSDSKNLTASLTALYYGTYNLLSALLIGDVNNDLTLQHIENFSKNGGHGLKTIYNENEGKLEENEFIFCSNNGFFKELLVNLNYNVEQIVMPRNYKKIDEIPENEIHKLISLKDLLSRIPEIKNIYVEIFKEQPNYINYYSSKLYDQNDGFCKINIGKQKNSEYLTVENIYNILEISPEFVFEYTKEYPESPLPAEFRCGKLPLEALPEEPKYKSPIADEYTLKPLVTLSEPILMYFILLYILSIWTRYRPNLWREISEGKHDQFRSLFGIFTDATERIVPNAFLNKFYGRLFLFAGHSYYS